MKGISFSCPDCGAQIPVPDGSDPVSCPKCGYAMTESQSAFDPKAVRHCMNCKQELRSGVTLCTHCGTDQETGRRSFASGKPRIVGAIPGDGRLNERSFPLSYVLLVLGVGIAVCIFLLMRYSAPSAPSIPPTTLPPVIPSQLESASNQTPVAFQVTNTAARPPMHPAEDPLKTALSHYATALRQGKIDEAQQARLQIERRFASGDPAASFWKKTFAPTSCMYVTLYYLCTVCTDGTCPVCHNAPSCSSCKGSGTCSACGGAPTRKVPCPSCVCQVCDGTRRCVTCFGSGAVGCTACNAIGYTDQRNAIACASCNGTGQRKGLRTGNGFMSIRCMTCNGTGRITQRIRQLCASCAGQTRVKCPKCSGTALCAACRGIGRTQACVACGGKGTVDVVCNTCRGSRRCPTCSGIGHCRQCLGSGGCYLCRRTSLIREAQLPVSSAWLTRATGYVLFDAESRKVIHSGDGTGRQDFGLNGRSLLFNVASNEVVWISLSTTTSFQQTALLFVPQ